MEPQEKKLERSSPIAVSVAVVIAGALIATAIYISSTRERTVMVGQQSPSQQSKTLDAMDPVTSEDHIRGDINAPVKIVEYSDTECPFCKKFHDTMKQVVEEYGKDGRVAWIYRHFPLDLLHSKARKEAEATECAAGLGGNDKFWEYLDRLMEVTPANNGLDPAELPKIAQFVGLDVEKFNECLSGGTYAEKVEEHVQNAMATGGKGTPWSIVVGKDGRKFALTGAQTYTTVKQFIDLELQKK